MTEEIIRKLKMEIDRGIRTEPEVMYLLAQIRKLIERDDKTAEYSGLDFHCDWVLHSKHFYNAIHPKTLPHPQWQFRAAFTLTSIYGVCRSIKQKRHMNRFRS